MNRWLKMLALAVFLPAAGPVAAQQGPYTDPLAEALFAPELVMRHRARLEIDDAQWAQISGQVKELQREVVDLEWEMAEAAQELLDLVTLERVPEEETLAAAMRIFRVEGQIKTIHLRMLVRIKNVLTPRQQDELRRIRGGT